MRFENSLLTGNATPTQNKDPNVLPRSEVPEDEATRKGDAVALARSKADNLRNLGKKDYEKGNYLKAAQLYKEVRDSPATLSV